MNNNKSLTLIKIKALIDTSMRADYDCYWQNKTKLLDDIRTSNPKEFFRKIKHFKGTGPKDLETFLKHNGKTVTDPKEIAQTFANVWEEIFSPHEPNHHNRQGIENIERVNTWINNNSENIKASNKVDLNRLSKNYILTHPISKIAVKQQILKIKSPASGISGHQGEVLKQLPDKTIIHITRIFNAMLATDWLFSRNFKKRKNLPNT